MKVLKRQFDRTLRHTRRGSLVPAVAIAIIVVGTCLALVLDSLWLETASLELQHGCDAAALAAANEMVCDELLTPSANFEAIAARVRQQAANIAGHNTATGKPIIINPTPGTDVAIGRVVVTDKGGEPVFLETDSAPSSVVVLAHCDRRHGNPISLFFPHLTGHDTANIVARSEATVNNRVVGIRPLDDAPAPAMPLGILEIHSDPRRTDTWAVQIDGRQGQDNYKYNYEENKVELGSDGIPEIVLHSTLPGNEEEEEKRGNVQLVDVGTHLRTQELVRQIKQGWRWQDLQKYGSEFRLDKGPISLPSLEHIEGASVDALGDMLGKTRIVVLYRSTGRGLESGRTHAVVQRLVAVRVLHVRKNNSSLEMTVQPTVMATRTALADDTTGSALLANPYIYRLSLTY